MYDFLFKYADVLWQETLFYIVFWSLVQTDESSRLKDFTVTQLFSFIITQTSYPLAYTGLRLRGFKNTIVFQGQVYSSFGREIYHLLCNR